MKFDRFYSKYQVTKPLDGDPPVVQDSSAAAGLSVLQTGVYNNGLYTIILNNEAAILTGLAESVFPHIVGKITVFAVDWMGRLFAIDELNPNSIGLPTVSCYDLAEPSAFATDASFDDFHNIVAIDEMNDLFNINQYRQWIASNPSPDDGRDCIGYKLPLFLGGSDDISNMEQCDRSVYLFMLCQLWSGINGD